jgi:glutaredoxin
MFNKLTKTHYAIAIVVALIFVYMYNCKSTNLITESSSTFVVYGSMRCGYTVKMLDHLKELGQSIRFVDVNTAEGDAEFKKVTEGKNIRGIPFTIDTRTGKEIAGFQKINI